MKSKSNWFWIIVVIIVAVVGVSMIDNSNKQREYGELNPTKDFSAYTNQQYITNPKFLQNPNVFLIDSNGTISSEPPQATLLADGRFGREVWVERVMSFSKKTYDPYLLLSYTYTRGGENIIGFYLQSLRFGYWGVVTPVDIDGCVANAMEGVIDGIFTNKYVLLEREKDSSHVSLKSTDGDVILKQQDVDVALLGGVTVHECVYVDTYASRSDGKLSRIPATSCFSDKSKMVSGRELLVINGYDFEQHPSRYDSLKSVAILARKGAWGACAK